jgi:hypothetical protein
MLSESIPPVATRLRRDFGAVLMLIRAHAMLHRARRKRDAAGKIIATLDDYRVVRELVAPLVSEGVEKSVPSVVRETVEAIAALSKRGSVRKLVSLPVLANRLGIDKSSASRRVQTAIQRGYIRNLETQQGKPGNLALADSMPKDRALLPTAEELRERCSVAGNITGIRQC